MSVEFLRSEISKLTGISEDQLTATTSDELFDQAENILASRRPARDLFADWLDGKPVPEVSRAKATRDQFADWLEAILGDGA